MEIIGNVSDNRITGIDIVPVREKMITRDIIFEVQISRITNRSVAVIYHSDDKTIEIEITNHIGWCSIAIAAVLGANDVEVSEISLMEIAAEYLEFWKQEFKKYYSAPVEKTVDVVQDHDAIPTSTGAAPVADIAPQKLWVKWVKNDWSKICVGLNENEFGGYAFDGNFINSGEFQWTIGTIILDCFDDKTLIEIYTVGKNENPTDTESENLISHGQFKLRLEFDAIKIKISELLPQPIDPQPIDPKPDWVKLIFPNETILNVDVVEAIDLDFASPLSSVFHPNAATAGDVVVTHALVGSLVVMWYPGRKYGSYTVLKSGKLKKISEYWKNCNITPEIFLAKTYRIFYQYDADKIFKLTASLIFKCDVLQCDVEDLEAEKIQTTTDVQELYELWSIATLEIATSGKPSTTAPTTTAKTGKKITKMGMINARLIEIIGHTPTPDISVKKYTKNALLQLGFGGKNVGHYIVENGKKLDSDSIHLGGSNANKIMESLGILEKVSDLKLLKKIKQKYSKTMYPHLPMMCIHEGPMNVSALSALQAYIPHVVDSLTGTALVPVAPTSEHSVGERPLGNADLLQYDDRIIESPLVPVVPQKLVAIIIFLFFAIKIKKLQETVIRLPFVEEQNPPLLEKKFSFDNAEPLEFCSFPDDQGNYKLYLHPKRTDIKIGNQVYFPFNETECTITSTNGNEFAVITDDEFWYFRGEVLIPHEENLKHTDWVEMESSLPTIGRKIINLSSVAGLKKAREVFPNIDKLGVPKYKTDRYYAGTVLAEKGQYIGSISYWVVTASGWFENIEIKDNFEFGYAITTGSRKNPVMFAGINTRTDKFEILKNILNKTPIESQECEAWWERYNDYDPIYDVAFAHIVARQKPTTIVMVQQKGKTIEPTAQYPIPVEKIEFPYPNDIDPHLSIGASRIANVCGFGYSSTMEEYLQMQGDLAHFIPNKKMIFGQIHEKAILQTYELTTGRKLTDHQKLFVDEKLRIHCHVDSITVNEINGTKIVVEAKYSSEYMMNRENADGTPVWGENGSDVFPAQYHFQLQQQMLLTGCTRADLAVQFGNVDFRIYSVASEPKLQEIIKEKSQWFWQLVDTDTPPPAENHQDVKILYKDQLEKETVELSTIACQAIAAKEFAETKIKELQAEIESARMIIEEEIGGADVGICADGRKITRKIDKNGNMRIHYPKQQ